MRGQAHQGAALKVMPALGFAPVYDKNSRVLILGSFPSVKSRAVSFYYGNKQNRFWKTLYSYFGEEYSPDFSTEQKKEFLLRKNIALWDIVTECDIIGSADSRITNYTVADLYPLLAAADIRLIILNGATAYKIFLEKYRDIGVGYVKLTSTSPANPRFNADEWRRALDGVFKADQGA